MPNTPSPTHTGSSHGSDATRLRRLAPGRIEMPLGPPLAQAPAGQADSISPRGISRATPQAMRNPAQSPKSPVGRLLGRQLTDASRQRSHLSHSTVQSPGTPWEHAAQQHSVQVAPEAMDYFQQVTAERHSWRAIINLALVAGGRCTLALGLAGVLEAYVPGPVGGIINKPDANGVVQRPVGFGRDFHPWLFGLGLSAVVVGLTSHTIGIARFYNDTAAINARRGFVVASIAMTGAVLVTAGGAVYLYAVIADRGDVAYGALPLRALGNFCVFGAIPNSFSSSEIVWGDIPIRNRILLRDLFFALGGMFLMTWAQLSSANPPSPLYARELAQVLGIICIAVGGALPRVDGQRAAADLREARRNNSVSGRRYGNLGDTPPVV